MSRRVLVLVAVSCGSAPHAGPGRAVALELTRAQSYVFEVRIDHSRPLRFELDTGAAATYLDVGVAKSLGLRVSGETTVHGAGREPIHVDQAAHVEVEVGDVISTEHTVNLVDLSSLPDHIDGFLGADFISRHVITIDYDRRELRFADPATFVYHGKGTALPIDLRRGLPFVTASVKAIGVPVESSPMLIDSGSTDAVDHPAILHTTGPVRHAKTGVGLGNGTGEGVVGHAEYLELGPYRLAGAVTACCGPNEDTNRALGSEVLRRFTVVLDYAHARIILEPGARFGDPFEDA